MKMHPFTWAGSSALFSFILVSNTYANDVEWLNQKLQAFETDPKSFINDPRNVEKFDADTMERLDPSARVSEESIRSRQFMDEKDRFRSRFEGLSARWSGRSAILKNDNPKDLVDQLKITTLQGIEEQNLTTSTLPISPWSDDYWPFFKGTLAKRYSDPNFPDSTDWKKNVNYVLNTDYNNSRSRYCSVDQLSPAEKYDLLVGDSNRTLTRAMIQDGASYYQKYGKVETWMGTCGGWAPASFSAPRPSQAINVIAANGHTRITFYPADIKALTSVLWDRAKGQTRFIGSRCNEKSPTEDENGRITSQGCFDTNPGAWHLSLVNQIGVSKRGMIMDATYDYEVWNQPIYSYHYSYFNPKTRKAVSSLQEAAVRISDFNNDVFSKYRGKQAAYVVGVVMKVVYISETNPTATLADSANQDKRVAVKYIYDLELDRSGNIIGGEWYQRQHPDFLWTNVKGSQPNSVGDAYLNNTANMPQWDGQRAFPAQWTQAAQYSSKYGQPLARVINTLQALSIAQ